MSPLILQGDEFRSGRYPELKQHIFRRYSKHRTAPKWKTTRLAENRLATLYQRLQTSRSRAIYPSGATIAEVESGPQVSLLVSLLQKQAELCKNEKFEEADLLYGAVSCRLPPSSWGGSSRVYFDKSGSAASATAKI
jgi:hypothetical protein